MTERTFSITPSTNIAELLEHYPELVDALIDIAPMFKNLRNPVMRKTMARFASVQTAADAARLPVAELVERLRAVVRQGLPAARGTEDTASRHASGPE